MKVLWRKDELPCQEMVELITDYLEGVLSRSQRRRFEGHLAGCEHCSEYLRQMRLTIEATGVLREQDLTADMQAEFGEVYRRWRAEDE